MTEPVPESSPLLRQLWREIRALLPMGRNQLANRINLMEENIMANIDEHVDRQLEQTQEERAGRLAAQAALEEARQAAAETTELVRQLQEENPILLERAMLAERQISDAIVKLQSDDPEPDPDTSTTTTTTDEGGETTTTTTTVGDEFTTTIEDVGPTTTVEEASTTIEPPLI